MSKNVHGWFAAGLMALALAGCSRTVTSAGTGPVIKVTHVDGGPAGTAEFVNSSAHVVLVEMDGHRKTLRAGERVTWSGLSGTPSYNISAKHGSSYQRTASGSAPASAGRSFTFCQKCNHP